jgi:hypothetical protein
MTPEEADAEDRAYWQGLTIQERLDRMMWLIYETTPPDQRRIERTSRLIILSEH